MGRKEGSWCAGVKRVEEERKEKKREREKKRKKRVIPTVG